MKPAGLLPLATLFGSLSLVSVGGANVLFPAIRRGVVDERGWMDAHTLTHLFAIAQAAPGPNIMLIGAVGWQVMGVAGLLVATVAILGPPAMIALFVGRLARRSAERAWLVVATEALVPLALGLMLASGVVAARAAGAGVLGYAIGLGTAAMVLLTRRNPLVGMAAGTLVFLTAHLLGAT